MALTENKPNREHNEQLHFARSERLTEHRKQDCSRITRTRPGQEYAQYDFRKGEHNIILVGLFFFSSFPKCTWRAGAETFVLSFHSAGSCPRCMAGCCCCCYCCQLSNLSPLPLAHSQTFALSMAVSFCALSASASVFESCLKSEKTSATRRR